MRPLLPIAALALAAERCGPSNTEIGRAVLMAWPEVLLVTLALQIALLALLRARYPDWRFERLAPLLLLTFAAGCAIAAALAGVRDKSLPVLAFWIFGCSYAAIVLPVTRLWVHFDRRWALLGANLVGSVPFIGLAAVASLGVLDDGKSIDGYYLLPGFGGWSAGPLALALFAEAAIRFVRARKKRGAA